MRTRAHKSGSIITRPGTDNLYIRYRVNGRQIQEATGTPDRGVAEALLQKRTGYANDVERMHAFLLSGKRTVTDGPSLRFSGQELKVLLNPVVYVYYRNHECLYVGKGCSMARPLDVNHHHRTDLESADELVIYPCL